MNKTVKLLALAIIVTLLIAISTLLIPSAANTNVVYISSNGKGTGASPSSPLGNSSGYRPANGMDKQNALYKAMDKLKSTGGTIVIVGEVAIDCAEARVPQSKDEVLAPCEFRTPKFSKGTKLTITSVYNNVDYRTKGAKLVLDYDTCNTTAIMFSGNTTIDDINIEYRYHEDRPNSWKTDFMLGGGGYTFVIGKNVDVTSVNTKTNSAGSRYPMLIGGHRYLKLTEGTNITVNSGTWSTVIAGSCGIGAGAGYGEVQGSASLTVNGGKIGTVVGTGELTQPSNTVHGSLAMTVTGGEIGKFYVSHGIPYPGNRIQVVFTKNAKVGQFFYAPNDYQGDLRELVEIVSIRNSSSVKITEPDYDAIQKENETPSETTSDSKPTAPKETKPAYQYDPELGMDFPVIPPVIWIALIIVSAVMLAATIIINKIKLKKLGKDI